MSLYNTVPQALAALRRGEMYREFEQRARDEACKLFPKEAS